MFHVEQKLMETWAFLMENQSQIKKANHPKSRVDMRNHLKSK